MLGRKDRIRHIPKAARGCLFLRVLNSNMLNGPKVPPFEAARANVPLGKQLGASLGELYVSAALVHGQPPALDRELEAGAVFGRCGLELDTSSQLINFSKVSNTDQRRTFERLHA
jgi:hypothetical protein